MSPGLENLRSLYKMKNKIKYNVSIMTTHAKLIAMSTVLMTKPAKQPV